MSREDSVIRFLTELGIFSDEDLDAVKKKHGKTIVDAMVKRKALAPNEVEVVTELIDDLMTLPDGIKKMRSQMSLLKIVTTNIHKRMASSCDRMREQKERITGNQFPVVALTTKAHGDG